MSGTMYCLLVGALLSVTAAAPVDESVVQQLVEEMKSVKVELQSVQMENQKLKSEMRKKAEVNEDELDKIRMNQNQLLEKQQKNLDTLFLATLNEISISIGNGEVIPWDSAPINPGGHFNTVFGSYIAPMNGYYQLTTIKRGNNYEGDFCILVDGDCVVYREEDGSADNYSPQGSASINLYLAAGQVVQVENRGSTSVYGYGSYGIESWFTGFLLYAV